METDGKKNPVAGRSTEGSGGRLWKSQNTPNRSQDFLHSHQHSEEAFDREETRGKELKAVSRQENKNAIALILLATLI